MVDLHKTHLETASIYCTVNTETMASRKSGLVNKKNWMVIILSESNPIFLSESNLIDL